jgi:hypothetical protein
MLRIPVLAGLTAACRLAHAQTTVTLWGATVYGVLGRIKTQEVSAMSVSAGGRVRTRMRQTGVIVGVCHAC